MKEKLCRKENIMLAGYSVVLVMLFFGINFMQEFSVDTYSMFEVSQWKYLLQTSGRAVTIFVIWLFEQLALPGSVVYFISWSAAILFLSLAVFVLAKMIYTMTECPAVSTVISFLTIANVFSIEYFLFVEKGMFMLALFMNVLAVYFFEKYMRGGKAGWIGGAFLCLLTAVFIYQTSLGLFVIISLPFIVKHSERIKTFFLHCLIAALLYGSNMLLAYLVLKKIFNSGRISDSVDILQAIKDTLPWLGNVTKDTLGILPSNVFMIVLLVIGGVTLICCVKYSEKKLPALLGVVVVILGSYVVGFFPYFVGISNSYSPRIIYPFASILGALLIYFCINQFNRQKVGYAAVCVSMVLMLLVQYFSFTEILMERYKVNQTDKYLTEVIAAEIQEQELRTGVGIKYVCFYSDQSITYCYPGLNTASFLSVRAHGTSWSDINSLNHLLGTSYEKGQRNDAYADYFSQQNWDVYNEDQLIFDGDTLHICVYYNEKV